VSLNTCRWLCKCRNATAAVNTEQPSMSRILNFHLKVFSDIKNSHKQQSWHQWNCLLMWIIRLLSLRSSSYCHWRPSTEEAMPLSHRSAVVNEEGMKPVDGWVSALWPAFSALTTVGNRNYIWPIKTCDFHPQRFSFRTRGTKNCRETAFLVLPGKWPLKCRLIKWWW